MLTYTDMLFMELLLHCLLSVFLFIAFVFFLHLSVCCRNCVKFMEETTGKRHTVVHDESMNAVMGEYSDVDDHACMH